MPLEMQRECAPLSTSDALRIFRDSPAADATRISQPQIIAYACHINGPPDNCQECRYGPSPEAHPLLCLSFTPDKPLHSAMASWPCNPAGPRSCPGSAVSECTTVPPVRFRTAGNTALAEAFQSQSFDSQLGLEVADRSS